MERKKVTLIMLKKNTYTALMATFFSLPLLAWGVEDKHEGPSINWVFEAPSSYTKDEFLSVGLSGDGNPIQPSIKVSEGMVFFSTYEGALYAVDEHDGSLIWSSDVFEESGSNIALHESLVFFGEGLVTDLSRNYGGEVVALNKYTGEEAWRYTTDDFSGIWGITTHAGNVIFATGNEVYALDALSGDNKWKFYSGDFRGGLSSKDGLVYFQARNTDVYALDATSGDVVFSHKSDVEADYKPRGTIALYEGSLTFASGSENEPFIYSYHIDGTKNWQAPLNGISLSSVVVDKCCVYLGTENSQGGSFHALDVNSGKIMWSHDNEGFVRHTPLILGDSVYFSYAGNKVVARNQVDGRLVSSFDTEVDVFTPIVPSSNGLLFGTFEGAVYSIKEP